MNVSYHYRDNDEVEVTAHCDRPDGGTPFVVVNISRLGAGVLSVFLHTAEQAEEVLYGVQQAFRLLRHHEAGEEIIDACDECGEYVDSLPPHASMCSFWQDDRPKSSPTWRTRKEMAND